MISGIVAQEFAPVPHGTLRVDRLVTDIELIAHAIVTSGDDQRLFPGLHDDPDDYLLLELPQVLTSDAIFSPWDNAESIKLPVVTIDIAISAPFYISADTVFIGTDIRMPGYLLPHTHVDPDFILPTPLILDPGMWRQEVTHFDPDAIFEPIIYAAQTMFPALLNDAATDSIKAAALQGSVLRPPFIIPDDEFFPFSSQTIFRAPLVIDSGRPVQPPTTWDGVNAGVNISSDGLNASLIAPFNYAGARTTRTKTAGKYYFEVQVGPSHGAVDQVGVMKASATLTQYAQGVILNEGLGVRLNYQVIGANGFAVAGTVIGNGKWFCHFGHSLGPNRGFLVEGDIIGVAVNLSDRLCWFRLNGGAWNNNQLGLSVLLNQNPETGVGGIPLPNGAMHPALGLGGEAGSANRGVAGDNMTANFGRKAYSALPPAGYNDWDIDSPFGLPINGDSFGKPAIANPASLDDGNDFVNMSNGFLTATHVTTDNYGGAISSSSQRSGLYYIEYTIGATHGQQDSVGLIITSKNDPEDAAPEGDLRLLSAGQACALVFLASGAIYSNYANQSKSIGPVVAGDVVGVALDLDTQSMTQGGRVWFRKKHLGVTSNWNGATLASDADPELRVGGLPMVGWSWIKTWAPVVGFSGPGNAVGDNITLNAGATPTAMTRPAGFRPWPRDFDDTVRTIVHDGPFPNDDIFPSQFIDLQDRQVFHPNAPVADDVIFPTTSFGGNLAFFPPFVADNEALYTAGFFPRFDVSSSQVTLSNGGLTATVNTAVAGIGAGSKAFQVSGKYYFEVLWTGAHANQDVVGVWEEGATFNDVWNCMKCSVIMGQSGILRSNDSFTGFSTGAPVSGDIIGIAVNLDTRRAWFRINNGLWDGNASHDPVTNNGGCAMKSLVPFAPAGAFNSAVGNAYTLNFGVSPFAFTVPLGFNMWPGNSVSQPPLQPNLVTDNEAFLDARIDPYMLGPSLVPADDSIPLITGSGGSLTIGPQTAVQDADSVFAPGASFQLTKLDALSSVNATLSNANLTATHSNTASDSGARSTSYKNAGKFYFEVTMTNIHGNFDCCGILLSTASFTNFVTNSSNCVSTFKSSGNIWSNNIYSGKTLGAHTSGDIISVAVDLTAHKAWLRKNGGNWNGLALASENPNTGVGGVTIATGAFAPAIGFGGSGTALNDAMTLNVGNSAYAFSPPTGFGNWTMQSDIPIQLAAPFIPNDDVVFPWTPSLLAALKAWYRADTLTGTDNAALSPNAWPDSSGLGNNPTAGNAPILQVAELNGKNVLQWGLNFAFMNLPNMFAGASAASVIMVIRATGTGGAAMYVGSDTSLGPQYPDSTNHVIDSFGSTTTKTTGVISGLTSWHIASFHSTLGLWKYFKNGVEQYATGTNLVGFNTSPQLGRFSGLSNFLQGMTAEIIFTNDFMSDADRQRAEGFLAHKWGLAGDLPVGHPYKATPP